MIYRSFPESLQAGDIHRVPSASTFGPLSEDMGTQRVSEVWGRHNVPFSLGRNALLGTDTLFLMLGSSKMPTKRALISAQTSPSHPDEMNICLAVADEDSDFLVDRPLLVPKGTGQRPDFSNILRQGRGYQALVCCVAAADMIDGYRRVVLTGDPGSGGGPEVIRVGHSTIQTFLEVTSRALEHDLYTSLLNSRIPRP